MEKTDKELKEIATTLVHIIEKQGCKPPDAMKVIDLLFNAGHRAYGIYLEELKDKQE